MYAIRSYYDRLGAVGEKAGEAFLTQVDVEHPDALAHPRERGGDMHRHGGFARAALFVPDHDSYNFV